MSGLNISIIQGENFAFKEGISVNGVDQDLTGWICDLKIVKKSEGVTGTAALQRPVTALSDANTRFLIEILPSETAVLTSGEYWLMVQLKKGLTDNSEVHHTLTINPGGIG